MSDLSDLPRLSADVGGANWDNPSRRAAGDSFSGPGSAGVGGGSPLSRRYFSPGVRDAAGDTLRALPIQRSQIRELVRVNPIAAGAINTNVDRVVGTGLALVARPMANVLKWTSAQAATWKAQVQTEFSIWADSTDCDFEGVQNFYDKQGLTLRSAMESGDCFTLLPDGQTSAWQPYALRLQTLEADRIGNPNGKADGFDGYAGGIKRLPNGARSIFVFNQHPGSLSTPAAPMRGEGVAYVAIGASGRRRILHHFKQLRPEQPRGVPYLAPVIDHLRQLGRYTDAEIQAAVMSAMFTVFIETSSGSVAPIFDGATDPNPIGNPEIELGAGAVIGLATGEKATFADPSRPNANFDPFVKAIVQQIGVGLGLPFELLVKQFNASYSASKAALLDAWMWFRGQRTWLARSFCQPIYETWLAEAIARERIAAPGFFTDPLLRWAYCQAEWHGDSMGTINPKDEVEAYSGAIDSGLMTRERAQWELFGDDFWQTADEKIAEHVFLSANDLLPPKPGAAAPNTSDTPKSTGTPAEGQT